MSKNKNDSSGEGCLFLLILTGGTWLISELEIWPAICSGALFLVLSFFINKYTKHEEDNGKVMIYSTFRKGINNPLVFALSSAIFFSGISLVSNWSYLFLDFSLIWIAALILYFESTSKKIKDNTNAIFQKDKDKIISTKAKDFNQLEQPFRGDYFCQTVNKEKIFYSKLIKYMYTYYLSVFLFFVIINLMFTGSIHMDFVSFVSAASALIGLYMYFKTTRKTTDSLFFYGSEIATLYKLMRNEHSDEFEKIKAQELLDKAAEFERIKWDWAIKPDENSSIRRYPEIKNFFNDFSNSEISDAEKISIKNSEFVKHIPRWEALHKKLVELVDVNYNKYSKNSKEAMLRALQKGYEGEEKLQSLIKSEDIPNVYYGLTLKNSTGEKVEIDALIVHDDGLVVIESKDYRADTITIDSSGYFYKNKNGVEERLDTLNQVNRANGILKSIFGRNVKIKNILVLTDENTKVINNFNDEHLQVIFYNAISFRLRNLSFEKEDFITEIKSLINTFESEENSFKIFDLKGEILKLRNIIEENIKELEQRGAEETNEVLIKLKTILADIG